MADYFSSTRSIKSQRKPHACTHCGAAIPAGDPAEVTTFSFDGHFASWRYHLDCKAAWNEIYHLCGAEEDGLPALRDIDDLHADYGGFLKDKFPAVAARLFPTHTKAGA